MNICLFIPLLASPYEESVVCLCWGSKIKKILTLAMAITDSCSCCSLRSGVLLMESEEWTVSWWAFVNIPFRILPFPS